MKGQTVAQRRIFNAVSGAVRNVRDAHPYWPIPPIAIQSIAKRATGTLTAQWPEVLAARLMPSETPSETAASRRHPSVLAAKHGWRGSPMLDRRSPLPLLWGRLSGMIGPAKRAGQQERAETLIEVCKLIATMQREKL